MMNRNQSVRDYYSDKSNVQAYDQIRFGNVGGRLVDEWEKAALLELIDGHPINEPIVEIAAGTGRFSLMLARMGYTVVAVDGSMEMLISIKNAAQEEGLSVSCVHADAFRLPFADNTFRTVFSMRFVWHFKNLQDVIKELARASKQFVIFDLINRTSLASITAPVANHLVYKTLHTELTSRKKAQEVLADLKLSTVKQISAFLFPYIFYRKLSFMSALLSLVDQAFLRVLPLGSVLYYKVNKAPPKI